MILWQTWWAEIYRAEYCLGGNYIRQNFLDYNNPGGNFPGESYPGWEFSRWKLSWVGIFQVGIVRVGVILGGIFLGGGFPCGNYPGGIIRVGIFRVGVFLVSKIVYIICWKQFMCFYYKFWKVSLATTKRTYLAGNKNKSNKCTLYHTWTPIPLNYRIHPSNYKKFTTYNCSKSV